MWKRIARCCLACPVVVVSACSPMCSNVSAVSPNILLNDTFEGPGISTSWPHSTSQNGMVVRRAEDLENRYQTQAHGEKSLFIRDPDFRSHANARHHVSSITENEYMVEFYFWLPGTSAFSTTNLYLYRPTRAGSHSDIVVVLDTVVHAIPDIPPHKWVLTIEDADGFSVIEIYLSFDQWHRFQIYHHPDWESETGVPRHVDLYIDGDSIGSYAPLGGIHPPDTFLFGTVDPLHNGEGFWDDVIVTTPPTGKHPKLLFDKKFVETLRTRARNKSPTPVGVSYAEIWESLHTLADSFVTEYDRFGVKYGPPSAVDGSIYMVFPYDQPPPHSDDDGRYWSPICGKIQDMLQTLSFAYVITDDAEYANRAASILVALANWRQWTDPDVIFWNPYCQLDTDHLVNGVSLAYDMIFNTLSNYERMTVQNGLLSLGVGQLYLNSEHYVSGTDPKRANSYAINNSSLGIASLAISVDDSAAVDSSLIRARDRIDTLFSTEEVCDSNGGWVEGLQYGVYALTYCLVFVEANRRVTGDDIFTRQEGYLRDFLRWRLYNMKPGGVWEVNFCDAHNWRHSRTEMLRLASEYQDGVAQWNLSKSSHSQLASGGYFKFCKFLWLDGSLDTLRPDDPVNPLPLGQLFPNIGWVDLRSGWDSNDYLIAFKSGHYPDPPSHVHQDNNSFILGTDSGDRYWLIADLGYGYKSAYNHNVILVDGDSTQRIYPGGTIDRFYTSEDYGFVVGDAGECYERLSKWLRKIVLVNEVNPYFIIKDEIASADGQPHRIDWLLHTWGKTHHNGKNSIRIRRRGECADVRVLLPEDAEIQHTTLPVNKEFWHHIAVSPVDKVVKIDFLTAFLPHDLGQSPPSVNIIDGTTMVGVRVSGDSAQGIVMFSREGGTIDNVEYSFLSSGSDSAANVLVDMRPDSRYSVLCEDLTTRQTILQEVRTTSEGTMMFKISDNAPRHRVRVVAERLTPKSP